MSTNLGIASDEGNANFQGARNPDDVLHVTFFMKSVKDNFQSDKQGRPIFVDIPYVRIMTPGNALNIIEVPARREHMIRFPRHWAVFQNSQSQEQIVGTRVEEWPMIGRALAEEAKGLKFYTVEQIAGASDEQLQRLGMNGQMLKQKAIAYLKQAENTAYAQQQVSEIKKRDEQIDDLKAMVQRLAGEMEQMKNKSVPEVKEKRKYTKRQPEGSGTPVQTKGPDA